MIAYIPFERVLSIHDEMIREYGGLQGILSEGLLKSALEMPRAQFNGKDLHPTIFDKTAAYLFHLIQNHPFVDGNKRSASMVTLLFFMTNFQGQFSIPDNEYQDLILGTAQGIVSKRTIAQFFRQRSKKR